MHTLGGREAAAEGFGEVSFCAFCAAPMPEAGFPCCEDYAATLDQSPAAAVTQALPVRAEQGEPKSGARFTIGSYVLLGVLVTCVSILVVALIVQMRRAAERERELAATRLLSEEMIALMKEARGEAAQPAVAPQMPAVEAERSMEIPSGEVAVAAPPVEAPKSPADVPTGEAVAPPQAAPAVAAPAVAAPAVAAPAVAAPAVAAPAVAAPAVAAPAVAAPAVAAPAVAAPAVAAPAVAAPAVAAPAVAPPAVAPAASSTVVYTAKGSYSVAPAVKVVKEKIETRRPSADGMSRENAAEVDRAPSAEAATAIQKLASLPRAAGNAALPARPTIVSGWTKLERGMSRNEVRRLLGKPRSSARLKSAEFWFYAERSMFARGWVAFRESGGVIEWLTP